MWGQPVKADAWLEGAQIVDLAPTILHLLGQPVPPDMDGRVLLEALQPEYAERQPVATPNRDRNGDDSSTTDRPEDEELSEEAEELIRRRLRGLGYVG